ncbi:MAG: hypothetical protein JRI80_19360, partial [Deltaproteobacteria bacterium]|nr:hypothetical protein [Deltaproteobacteria bacterium]
MDYTDGNYTVTFLITEYDFQNDVVVREINITANKTGYESQEIVFNWTTSENLTEFTLDTPITQNTTYSDQLLLEFTYNYTSSGNPVLNPDNISVIIDDNPAWEYTMKYNGTGENYYIYLNTSDDYGFGTHSLDAFAQKYGHRNHTILNVQWNITEASTLGTCLNGSSWGTTYYNHSYFATFNWSYSINGSTVLNPDTAILEVVGEKNETLLYDSVTDLYNITLNTTDVNAYGGFGTKNIVVYFEKFGHFNETISGITWRIAEAPTSIEDFHGNCTNGTLINAFGNQTSLGTYYWPVNFTFDFMYNRSEGVLDDAVANVSTVNETGHEIFNKVITYDSASGYYNFTLNYSELGFRHMGLQTITVRVNISKFGFTEQYFTFNITYDVAITEIAEFFVNSSMGTYEGYPGNSTDIGYIYYPETLNISFRYNWSSGSIGNAVVNCSIDGQVNTSITIDYLNGYYNLTLNYEELNFAFAGLQQIQVVLNISKTGYAPQFFNFTLTYTRTPMETWIFTNATQVGNYHTLRFDQDLNVTVFLYNQRTGPSAPIAGAEVNMTINGIVVTMQDLGGGWYHENFTANLPVGNYTLDIDAQAAGYELHTNQSQIIEFNETLSMLTINATALQVLHYGDSFFVNLTYWDTYWNRPILEANISSSLNAYSVGTNASGNYTFRVELDNTMIGQLTAAGVYTITFTASHKNHTVAINNTLQVEIWGDTGYELYNSTDGVQEVIGQDLTATKNFTVYEEETSLIFLNYTSINFTTIALTGATITTNWTNTWTLAAFGTQGVYLLKFNTLGLTGNEHWVQVNISQNYYENQTINILIWIIPKIGVSITFGSLPSVVVQGSSLTVQLSVNTTLGNPIAGGTVYLYVNGKPTETLTTDANGAAEASIIVPAGTKLEISAEYIGNYSTSAKTVAYP